MKLNIIFNILQAIAAVILPIGAVYYIKNKFSGKIRNAFHGAAVFLIFYCFLYAVVATCVEFATPLYEKVESDLWLIIINVFFETVCVFIGYIIWFKAVIKVKDDNGVGLMTGTGFAFIRTIFSHGITAVLNFITGILFISGKLTAIPEILEDNYYGFLSTTPYYSFLLLLQLLALFFIEVAVAFIIYRVKRCEDRKVFSLFAFVLRMAAVVVTKCGIYIDRGVIVVIVTVIALIIWGGAYSLLKPLVKKVD